jgi:predicted nucleotidyltransferase
MERDKIKEILQKLNEANIAYAIIGGMAMAHYCPPRLTQDLDLIVLAEDAGKVRQIFSPYYQRGTVIAGIYDYQGTRFDVQPASLRLQRSIVDNAIDDKIDELPVKVARLHDLIVLKLIAAPNRPEMGKRMRDQTDVVELIEYNHEKITAQDIAHICQTLLQQAYTLADQNKALQMIQWLNETLDELELSNRKYLQIEG